MQAQEKRNGFEQYCASTWEDMHLFQRNDFCGSINTLPQVMQDVYLSFVSMADEVKAACDNFDKLRRIGGGLIKVQGSLLGFIWSALKRCVNDEGVIDTSLVELLTEIEAHYFFEVAQLFLTHMSKDSDLEQFRVKLNVKRNDLNSMLPKILRVFSSIMETSKPSISMFSQESVLECLDQAIGHPNFIHKRHEKHCVRLSKLIQCIKGSNDHANWEYIFPLVEDALDSMSWFSFYDTWEVQPTSSFRNCIDSAICCTLLHLWVWQSSRSPHFTSDFIEAYVACIQEHLIWLLEKQHCIIAEQTKGQIEIMQDLLRLVLSLFSHASEHEKDRVILSHTQAYVNPALMKLGAALHSFTVKRVNGEKVNCFEITDWFIRAWQALFLPLDSDCLLSNEALIHYAYYYRHYLFGLDVDTDESKFDKDLVFVTRVVFHEWSEHHVERERLLDGRVQIVGVLRGLGSIICSSLNNGFPLEQNPGIFDLIAKFELVKVQFTRKISLQIMRDLSPQVPKPNLVVFLNVVCENLEEIICNSNLVKEWNNQLRNIQDELAVFRSYLQNTRDHIITDSSSQDLTVRITNAVYDAEYIINAFACGSFHTSCRSYVISDLIERCGLIEKSILNSSNVLLPRTNLKKCAVRTASRVSVPPVDVVVGFEVVMKEMMECLTSFSKQLDVVSVVGMPGIGKTTLARKVYEDPYIVNHFDLRGWCSVSQEFTRKDLLIDLLGADGNRQESTETLEVKLHKKLTRRKYLIVIDDVWEIDAYDYLRRFCQDDGKGSRIVLTSRIKSMGKHSKCLELDLLSDDDSWNLLKQKVCFDNECPMELCEIGKEISRKCGGLPLAVVVVAGILAKLEKEEDAWNGVAEKNSVYNADDCEEQRMKALDLSYEFLPDHLKPLFLYIGAFPEDSNIRVSKLTRLWIGEGFIRKSRKRSLEAEAEAYLMDLIDRSLLLFGNGDFGNIGALCDIVGDQSNFENHKMLRVFDMGEVQMPDDWLTSVTLPVHLRYIEFNGYQPRGIPSSVFSLWNLETLIIRYLFEDEMLVPGEVWKMAKLRHLHIRAYISFRFTEAAEEYCTCTKLENLQTLSTVKLYGAETMLIGRFRNLVKLKCVFSISGEKSGWPRLESLHQLQSLNVRWRGGKCNHPQFSLPSTLKTLSLKAFGLEWKDLSILQQLPNLEILKLRMGSVFDELWDMGDGVFPKLKYLKLRHLNIKQWIASDDNIPCLENLVLEYCKYLEEIPSSFGDICSLVKIELDCCSHRASESAKRIEQEQVEEFGNDFLKVHIIDSNPPKR